MKTVKIGSELYECKSPWPEQSEITIRLKTYDKGDALEAMLAEEEGRPVEVAPKRYSFIGYIPAPESIPVRDRYYPGGFQRKKVTFVGYGASYEECEAVAYKEYIKVSQCNHVWHRHTMSDDAKTMLLDGDCSCGNCRVYVHNLQMDQQLFDCMNLAWEAHDGQTRKYNGAPYIVHPGEVYSRVAWWRALPLKQWLLMARAAWLHDVGEDCPHVSDKRLIDAAGEDGFNLICELTNPSKGSSAPRRDRKQMDRDHLAKASWEAKIIKMFDRIANLRDMKQCPDKSFLALYASESRMLLDVVKDADTRLADELLGWIDAAEKWSKL